MSAPNSAEEAEPPSGPQHLIGPVEKRLRRFWRFAREHAGLATSLIPLIAAALFVMRSFAAARYSPNVSLDLIMLSNPSDVFRQVGVTAFQVTATLGGIAGLALLGEGWHLRRFSRVMAGGIPGLVLTCWLVLVSIPDAGPLIFSIGLIPSVTAFVWGYLGKSPLEYDGSTLTPDMRSWKSQVSAFLILFAGAVFVYLLSAYGGIWRPPEAITIMGSEPQTLYVLDEPGDALIIFDEHAAKIFRVAANRITARQFCVKSGYVTHGMQRCP